VLAYGRVASILGAVKLIALSCLCMSATLAMAAEPVSGTLSRRDLLAAAFPAWQPVRDSTGKPSKPSIDAIAMPQVSWPWPQDGTQDGDPPATTVQIVPINVTRLDDTHAVLVTWALPVGGGRDAACDFYYCRYALGAYFFTWEGTAWHLGRRIDVAADPYGSEAPKVRVEKWPGRGFVLGASQQHRHGGDSVEHLTLLGLAPDQLTFSFQTDVSKHDGGVRDCEEVLDPSYKLPQGFEGSLDCEEAEGTWHVDGDAIRIDFAERSRMTDDGGRLLPLTEANFFARLQPGGGSLRLIEGKLGDYAL
jgi:hypothetical protein